MGSLKMKILSLEVIALCLQFTLCLSQALLSGPGPSKEVSEVLDQMKNYDQEAADRYAHKVLKPALKLLYSEENRAYK